MRTAPGPPYFTVGSSPGYPAPGVWCAFALQPTDMKARGFGGRKFQTALIFLFFEPSESTAPLFPPPGHAGSDGGGPRSVWAL